MNKPKNVIVAALFFTALILRLIGIGSREIFYDDAFSVLLSGKSLAQIVSGTAADTMPPLYYFFLHFCLNFGQSLIFLRLTSVIISMAILVVSYDLIRRVFGWTAAVWGLLFLAVSPLQIYHAQELRMYTWLVFSQVSYFWFFYRLFFDRKMMTTRPIFWAGLILSGTAAMYSHNLAIFGLAAANLMLIIQKRWKELGKLCLLQLGIFVLSIPWLGLIPGQIQKIQTAFWTPQPGGVEFLQAVIQMTAFLPLQGIWFWVAAILSVEILVIVIIETAHTVKKDSGILFFAVMALFLPVALFIVSYVMRPVFVARAFMISTVAYAGLLGRIVSLRWRNGIGPFLLLSVLVCAGVSLPSFYSFNDFPRSPYRQLAAWLEANANSKDVIVHENKLSYFPTYFYNRDLNQVFLRDEPGSHNDTYAEVSQKAIGLFPEDSLNKAVGQSNAVIFVVYSQALEEYQEFDESGDPNLVWLKENYQQVNHEQFNDLEVFTFKR